MNTISALTGISAIGSSTSQSKGQEKQAFPRQGQVFKASVVEGGPGNTFIIDIGGNRVPVKSHVQLIIGQSLHLQVISHSPQVELQIVSDSANLFQGKTLTLVGKNIDLTSLLQSLQTLDSSSFADLTATSRQTLESYFNFSNADLHSHEGGVLLKNLIDKLGINLEALVVKGEKNEAQATLKSALLELAQVFKGAEVLSDTTNKLINTLELYQLAQLQLEKDNLFIFPLPIPFLEKGYLLVEDYQEHRESAQEKDLHFSLHLSMVELGNLCVEFLRNSEGLFIRFVSHSQEKLNFFEQYKDDLLNNLSDTPIAGLSFIVQDIDPATDLLQKLLPNGKSLVNTKV